MIPQRVIHSVLRVVAVLLFAVYLAWNTYFLVQGRVPRSLMKGFFGIPSPTTGGTRSMRSLLAGDLAGSLAWNALTLPILALFVMSVAVVLVQFVRRRRLRLPPWALWAWLVVLTAAWILKLTGSPAYW